MKTHLFSGAILLLSLGFTSSIFGQLTLSECQNLAKDNYPLIAQYDLIEQTKEYSMSNAKRNYLPHLEFNLIGGVIEGFPEVGEGSDANGQFIGFAEFNQLIWDGGITKSQKSMIEAQSKLQSSQVDAQLYQVKQKISDLYFGILLLESKQESLQGIHKALEEQLSKVRSAVDNEVALSSDLEEVKIVLLENEQGQSQIQTMIHQYRQMLGHFINQSLEDIRLIDPVDQAFELASSYQRPEYESFEAQQEQIEAKQGLDQSMLYPKIGLVAFGVGLAPEVGIGPASTSNIFVAGLSVNWSIDGLFKNKNNKQIAIAQSEQIKVNKQQFDFNLKLVEQDNEAQIEKYSKLFKRSQEIETLKQNVADLYKVRYDQGVITVSDLLLKVQESYAAKQEVRSNKLYHLKAIYDYNHTTGKQ